MISSPSCLVRPNEATYRSNGALTSSNREVTSAARSEASTGRLRSMLDENRFSICVSAGGTSMAALILTPSNRFEHSSLHEHSPACPFVQSKKTLNKTQIGGIS